MSGHRAIPLSLTWCNLRFLSRLLLSYLLVPLIPPFALLIWTRAFTYTAFGDWIGIVSLYGVFGLGAMLVVGTPLLLIYLRLGWSGFVSFAAGGALCAGATAYAFDARMAMVFALTGGVSGLLFRVILFGFRRHR